MFTVRQILAATQGKLICGNLGKKIYGLSIDSRSIKPGELFLAIKGEHFNGRNFIQQAIDKGAAAIIFRSIVQGEASHTPAIQRKVVFIQVADTLRALGNIAHCHRQKFDIPIIAITGSNGKTTTKEMIAATLERKYSVLKNEANRNNLIGIPLSLLKLEPKHKVAVIEMGMSRWGEIARLSRIVRPCFGVITNIGPSHFDHLKDLTAVAKAKGELLKNLDRNAAAILNRDDPFLKTMSAQNFKCKMVTFGINKPAGFRATKYAYQNEKLHFTVNHKYPFLLKISGEYNLYNALASIAVCAQLNINYGVQLQSLAAFSALPRRGEIKEAGGVTIIDHSYNSNPQSLAAAIKHLRQYKCRGKRVLVIGDMLELGKGEKNYHRGLGKIAGNSKVDLLLTLGELSKVLAKSAEKQGMDRNSIFICPDKHKVLEVLLNKVSPGDVVLIKGSREMHMEEITRCFITSYTL